MKDPKHIMNGIAFLQNAKVKKPLPKWLYPLDLTLSVALVCGWYGGLFYLTYTLISWL
jgi:hypothetical protein